jgi:hypothetical protein
VHCLFFRLLKTYGPKWGSAFRWNSVRVGVVALLTTLFSMQLVGVITLAARETMGQPGPRTMGVTFLLACGVAARSIRQGRWDSTVPADKWLAWSLVSYFACLSAIIICADPASHISWSIHQELGQCGVLAHDMMGLERQKFLCGGDFDEDFRLDECDKAVGSTGFNSTKWYTICGKAHVDYPLWVGSVLCVCGAGIVLYFRVLGRDSAKNRKKE